MLAAMFSPRIGLRPLGSLCRRLSTMLDAGVDIRKVFNREAERARGFFFCRKMNLIAERIGQGDSLDEALEATGDYFPPLFRRIVGVGETTGRLAEALRQMAEHYEQAVRLRRTFRSSIAGPMLQLGVAILVIGLLIWILGVIGRGTGQTLDILGGGMVGERGLAIYITFISTVTAVVALLIYAAHRGIGWVGPVQKLACYLPVLGPALRTLALARITWALHLSLDSGMELRKALRLSLETGANAYYTDAIPAIDSSVSLGNSLTESFERSRVFPDDFIEVLRVGEESGLIAESMGRIARDYNDRAAAALKVLTMLAGFLVWAAVAALIIVMIFRIFSAYLGAINSALPGR